MGKSMTKRAHTHSRNMDFSQYNKGLTFSGEK